MKIFFKFISILFFSQMASADILFLNINENQSELKNLKLWVNNKNKGKNCQIDLCERVHVIPKDFPSPFPLNNEIVTSQFNDILKNIKKENRQGQIIDKIIISGHSDGQYYSGANDRLSKPNLLSVNAMVALFAQSARRANAEIENDANFFQPQALILMGCHSLKQSSYTEMWFQSALSVRSIIGTEEVWPLGESKNSAIFLKQSLDISQKIIENDQEVSVVSFYSGISKKTYLNHNIVWAIKNKSSDLSYAQLVAKDGDVQQNTYKISRSTEIDQLSSSLVRVRLNQAESKGVQDGAQSMR